MSEASATPGLLTQVGLALRGAFRFAGRSRRSELLSYLVFQLVAVGVASLVSGFLLDRLAHDALALTLSVILGLPMVALTVRRLHDFGAKAVWAVPIFALAGYNTAMSIAALTHGAEARLAAERVLWPLDWLAIVVVMGALVVAFAPGTKGPNRFGPDPRETA